MKRTQRTTQAVRETVIPEAIEPRERRLDADGHALNAAEAYMEGSRNRSGSEGLPGSKGAACVESHGGNPGDPVSSSPNGRVGRYNRKEGRPKGYRESDVSVVLGVRESRAQGEGTHRYTQPSNETSAGNDRPDYYDANIPEGNGRWFVTEASLPEEPVAGIPHGGICGGAGRQLPVLRRLPTRLEKK